MAKRSAVQEVHRLLDSCGADGRHKATSVRLDENLRRAAEIAVEQGWAASFTALVEEGLALRLADVADTAAEQASLDAHYRAHPEARPDLGQVALAAARLDASALADHPDLIRRAADALGEGAEVDEVLLWAAGALAATAAR